MAKPNGGPAFPSLVPFVHVVEQGKDYPCYDDAGMSLRDYFAAKAISAIVMRWDETDKDAEQANAIVAKQAYALADAMLEERNK